MLSHLQDAVVPWSLMMMTMVLVMMMNDGSIDELESSLLLLMMDKIKTSSWYRLMREVMFRKRVVEKESERATFEICEFKDNSQKDESVRNVLYVNPEHTCLTISGCVFLV